MRKRIEFIFNGKTLVAHEGQTIAGALIASGIWTLGRSLATGRVRGPFCGMGVCFECEVLVNDNQRIRACMSWIESGMVLTSADSGAIVDGD